MSPSTLIGTADDLHRLERFFSSFGTEPRSHGFDWSLRSVAEELSQSRGVALCDDRDPKVLHGFILWREVDDLAEMMALAVSPAFRGRGVGGRLIDAARQQSAGRSWWLEVHHENQGARRLYSRSGFMDVGRRPRYYRDGGDAITMSWSPPLGPSFAD